MSRARRGGGRFGLLRSLNYIAFMPLAARAPMYGRLLLELLRDERVPTAHKAILALPVAYLALPVDLVPEFLPVIGALDDVAVIVLALDIFLESVPRALLDEKLAALEIDPAALEADLARVRRFVPRPVRRAAAQVPMIFERFGAVLERAGVERRLRDWISEREWDAEDERRLRAARPLTQEGT